MSQRTHHDAVIIGAGHNGLTAAAYLARAGLRVVVLERLGRTGGAAVTSAPFPGVDVRLSRYAYLVSLLPRQIVDELNLRLTLRRRQYASYTPSGTGGLLIDPTDTARTAASFADVTGSDREYAAWREFHARLTRAAGRIFPTMTWPLLSRAQLRRLVDDDEIWAMLVDEPIGPGVTAWFNHDVVRGTVLTDALIGTFTAVDDPSLRANRCFLYHVIGNGTGEWTVPVGGMGAVSAALEAAARRAGATIATRAEVTAVHPDGEVTYTDDAGTQHRLGATYVLAGCAPDALARLMGERPTPPSPEGAQLKINMVLSRLPRLRSGIDPTTAFSGTLHVDQQLSQLESAYQQAASGQLPTPAPVEMYCHSLTDPSVLGPTLRPSGAATLTLFALHHPARLFASDHDATRDQAVGTVLEGLDRVVAEPLEHCLYTDAYGRPCLEVHTPYDLERDLGMPGGHIFHTDLTWPFTDDDHEVGTWGVHTPYPNVLLCGAGTRRGGGVSGIPGRAAAMAILRGETVSGHTGAGRGYAGHGVRMTHDG